MYCVITGASNGFGLEFARCFAARGYNLCISARRENLLINLKNALEKEFQVHVDVVPADLSSDEGMNKLCDFVVDKEVDIFINNAGIATGGDPNIIDPTEEMNMFTINTRTMFRLTRHFVQKMVVQNKGRILNVSSISAWAPSPLISAYSAGKTFILNFSEGVNFELKVIKSNVRISVVTPGFFNTGIAGDHFMADQKRSVPDFIQKVVVQFLKGKEIISIGQDKIVPIICKFLPRKAAAMVIYKAILQKFPLEYK